MVVLVCGGRDFTEWWKLRAALRDIHQATPITKLVSGHARGADKMGEDWAEFNRVPVAPYPAKWDEHGKAAGAIRNQHMLDSEKIDHAVVCTPGPAGTWDMVRRLDKAGITYTKVGW